MGFSPLLPLPGTGKKPGAESLRSLLEPNGPTKSCADTRIPRDDRRRYLRDRDTKTCGTVKTEAREEMDQGRRLRMGMVGGGPGAFIGPVHRMGAELDGAIELVAGAFSQDAATIAPGGRDLWHKPGARLCKLRSR